MPEAQPFEEQARYKRYSITRIVDDQATTILDTHSIIQLRYRYRRLDLSRRSIRLLRVSPPSDSGVIRCELQEFVADEAPCYTALSYTWNKVHNKTHTIRCEDLDMLIGKNLWEFLSVYQFRTAPDTWIWVDAICINQGDVRERNHQVTQMQQTYSGAESVIVWLGADVEDAELAFQMVQGPQKLRVHDEQTTRTDRSYKHWRSLRRLFTEKRYWTRIWVVQEFILAERIELWCGAFSCDLVAFEDLCQWLAGFKSHEWRCDIVASEVLKSPGWTLCKHRIVKDELPFTFRDLLKSFAQSNSSIAHDRIYGLLGISDDASRGPAPIVVDYTKMPVEILVDVVRNQFQTEESSNVEEKSELVALLMHLLDVSFEDFILFEQDLVFTLQEDLRTNDPATWEQEVINEIPRFPSEWMWDSLMIESHERKSHFRTLLPGLIESIQRLQDYPTGLEVKSDYVHRRLQKKIKLERAKARLQILQEADISRAEQDGGLRSTVSMPSAKRKRVKEKTVLQHQAITSWAPIGQWNFPYHLCYSPITNGVRFGSACTFIRSLPPKQV